MYFTLVLVLIVLACSIWFNVKCVRSVLLFNNKHEELVDQIEQSLDILDECYQRITKATEIPLASDDPIIKDLLLDIKHAKDAVLLVANKIVSFDQPDDPDDKETDN